MKALFHKIKHSSTKHKVYFFISLSSLVLIVTGIIWYACDKEFSFFQSIFISIGASGIAGAITAFLIDLADNQKQKEDRIKALRTFIVSLSQYTLNLAYHYCDFTIGDEHVEVDCDSPIEEVLIKKYRAFSELRKPGPLTKDVEKIYKRLLDNLSFGLINIKRMIDDAISKNDIISHLEKYVFELRSISCDIERIYLNNDVDFASDKIAMIIEDISKLDIVSPYFTTFRNNDEIISLLYAKKHSSSKQN